MKKINLFIVISVLGFFQSFAQISTPSVFRYPTLADPNPSCLLVGTTAIQTNALVGGTLGLKTGKVYQPTHLIEKTNSAKLLLKLDLGEDYVSSGDAASNHFKVVVNIEYDFNGTIETKQLTVTDKSPEQLVLVDYLSNVNSGLINPIVTVKISNIEKRKGLNSDILLDQLDPNSFIYKHIANNLRVSAKIEREYAVDVRDFGSQLVAIPFNSLNTTATGKRMNFSWALSSGASTSYDFPNYELQVLRLFNTLEVSASNSTEITAKVDWSEALKVETQSYQKSIDLTVMEGTGYYIWRVRPIGTYYEGGIANSDNYGAWSTLVETGDVVVIDQSIVNSDKKYFYFTDPEEDLNWIYSRVFTEGNDEETGVRTSEGMTYADPLNRVRQSQAFNSEDNKTIVSQTISDYSGRAALSTLPVPVDPLPGEVGLSGYKLRFVQNDVGDLYTASDYDHDEILAVPAMGSNPAVLPKNSTVDNPSIVNDNGSDFSYYNGSQIDGVGDAEGYSFTRTKFKTDGTSRASEVSGIGATFALGTQRTSRVLFSSASDEELVRIFGIEAPLSESVIKTITIDPNNVVSVAYTSKEGKTIATALISNSTENLLPLEVDPLRPHSSAVKNSTGQSILENHIFKSSKRIALWENKNVKLTYHVDQAGEPCVDCKLAVEFYLIDLINNITYRSDADGFTTSTNLFVPFLVTTGELDLSSPIYSNWKWVLSNNSSVGNFTIAGSGNNEFLLNAGEYLLVKKVYSTNLENSISSSVTTESDAMETVLDAITQKMGEVTNEADQIVFDAFMTLLSTKLSATNRDNDDICNHLGIPLTPHFQIPSTFVLTYTSTGLEPGVIAISNSGCGGCPVSTVTVPKPDKCRICEAEVTATSTFRGIETIRNTPNVDLSIGKDAWKAIREIVDNGDPLIEGDGFIEYLQANTAIIANSNLLYDVAPGFTLESMSYMITNMLVSKYYTGKSRYDLVNGVETRFAADEDSDGLLQFLKGDGSLSPNVTEGVQVSEMTDIPFNYASCKEVYNCWIQAVDMINKFEFEGANNPMDEYNDRSDSETSEQEQDNPDNQEDAEDKSAFQGLMDFIISHKMRKFNDSDEGSFSPSQLNSFVSLPATFFECIGYQFAEILDEDVLNVSGLTIDYQNQYSDPENDNTIPLNLINVFTNSASTNVLPAPELANFGTLISLLADPPLSPSPFKTPSTITCNLCPSLQEFELPQLSYAYIMKPEWMFKYFVYNSSSNFNSATTTELDDRTVLIVSQPEIELITCYNDPYTNCTNVKSPSNPTGLPRCNKMCNYYHKSWSASQRYNFYTQIKGSYKCPRVECESTETPLPVVIPTCSSADLIAKANAKINDAFKICEDRSNEFRQIITSELLNSCYTIVDCVSPTSPAYEVSEAQIDKMVENVVNTCSTKVNSVQIKLNDPESEDYWTPSTTRVISDNQQADLEANEYPYCEIIGCVAVNSEGECKTTSYREVILFPPCDQLILDQVNYWNFDLNIPVADLNNNGLADDTLDCNTAKIKDWVNITPNENGACGNSTTVTGSTFTEKITATGN